MRTRKSFCSSVLPFPCGPFLVLTSTMNISPVSRCRHAKSAGPSGATLRNTSNPCSISHPAALSSAMLPFLLVLSIGPASEVLQVIEVASVKTPLPLFSLHGALRERVIQIAFIEIPIAPIENVAQGQMMSHLSHWFYSTLTPVGSRY